MAHILFVCKTFRPDYGQTAGLLHDTALVAARAGHVVTVLTPVSLAQSDVQNEFDARQPFTIIRDRAWREELTHHVDPHTNRLQFTARLLWKILRQKRVDCLVTGDITPLGNLAAVVRRMRKVPVILLTGGEEVATLAGAEKGRKILSTACLSAAAIQCPSKAIAWELQKAVPESRSIIATIPPEVRLASLEEAAGSEKKWQGLISHFGKRFMLSSGELLAYKGFDQALRAFHELRGEIPDLAYVITGEGPYRPYLEDLAGQLGLGKRVMFTGAVDDDDYLFHACEFFVLPCRDMTNGERETTAAEIYRASLAGKASLVGQSGASLEAVKHDANGVVVDAADFVSVAKAIRELVNDPENTARLGEAGRERAMRKTSPEVVQQQLLEMFSTVLNSPAAAPGAR